MWRDFGGGDLGGGCRERGGGGPGAVIGWDWAGVWLWLGGGLAELVGDQLGLSGDVAELGGGQLGRGVWLSWAGVSLDWAGSG